jgi:hypothetical protein
MVPLKADGYVLRRAKRNMVTVTPTAIWDESRFQKLGNFIEERGPFRTRADRQYRQLHRLPNPCSEVDYHATLSHKNRVSQ